MCRFSVAVITAALSSPSGPLQPRARRPGCASDTVRVQGKIVGAPEGAPCDSDPDDASDGLLGNAPLIVNLPGLGGVL